MDDTNPYAPPARASDEWESRLDRGIKRHMWMESVLWWVFVVAFLSVLSIGFAAACWLIFRCWHDWPMALASAVGFLLWLGAFLERWFNGRRA